MEQTKKGAKNSAKNIKNDASVTPLQKLLNDKLVKSGLHVTKILHFSNMHENNQKSALLITRNLSEHVLEADKFRTSDEFKTSCQIYGVKFKNVEDFAYSIFGIKRRWYFSLKAIGSISRKDFDAYVENLDNKRKAGEHVSYSYKELLEHFDSDKDSDKSDKKASKPKTKKLFNATLLGDTPKQVIVSSDKKLEKGSVSDALAQIVFLMQICEIEISTIEMALSQK